MKILRLLILLAALGGPATPVITSHGVGFGPTAAYAQDDNDDDQGEDNDDQGENEPPA
jgi:hypothetical protein